jgi:hypothetical protein
MSTDAPAFASLIAPPKKALPRTEWAEHQTQELLSIPFISEFVFRNVRTIDGKTPHQAGDFLILHRGSGILVEQKCQEDPMLRSAEKTALWARKNAKAGWKQLRRALSRPKDRPVWCDHQRRGRVEFPTGLPVIRHGIVIVEVFQTVDLEADARELPLELRNVPITYLSVNDFLNLAVSLRTVPELAEYFTARRSLPDNDLRVIGDENALFHYYLLNGASFAGCLSRADARIAIASQQHRLQQLLERKAESDHYSLLIEYVADSFASNHPKFEVGAFSSTPDGRIDDAQQMADSLELQAELADLRLRERAELGRAFDSVIQRLLNRNDGFVFRSVWLDSKPDWVYVFAASRNIDPSELQSRMVMLGRGAMAYYEKRRFLLVLDRDGRSIVTSLSRPGVTPTLADFEVGQRLFGHLRMTTTPLEIAPESRP